MEVPWAVQAGENLQWVMSELWELRLLCNQYKTLKRGRGSQEAPGQI